MATSTVTRPSRAGRAATQPPAAADVISAQAHLDLVHALIGKLTAERDAAYQAGWDDAKAELGQAA